jgi:hypothetical protein
MPIGHAVAVVGSRYISARKIYNSITTLKQGGKGAVDHWITKVSIYFVDDCLKN